MIGTERGTYKIIDIAFINDKKLPHYNCYCSKCNHTIVISRAALYPIQSQGRWLTSCRCKDLQDRRDILKLKAMERQPEVANIDSYNDVQRQLRKVEANIKKYNKIVFDLKMKKEVLDKQLKRYGNDFIGYRKF